jgi:hypothetical protein
MMKFILRRNTIESCWLSDYKKRTSFAKIYEELSKLYNNKRILDGISNL